MGLFDVFKSKENSNTIFDFLEMDIRTLPDDTFTYEYTDEEGNIKNYTKRLKYKECGLFNIVELIVFDEENYNVIFRSDNMDVIYKYVEELVNNLYSIYGSDDIGSGKFSDFDRDSIEDGFWGGRLYASLDRNKNKHKLNFSATDECFELIIFSPKTIPNY
jgi:hypothetical protein